MSDEPNPVHPSWCPVDADSLCNEFDESSAVHIRDLPMCGALSVQLCAESQLLEDGKTVIQLPPHVVLSADREPHAPDLTADDLLEAADVLRMAAERLQRQLARYWPTEGRRMGEALDRLKETNKRPQPDSDTLFALEQ